MNSYIFRQSGQSPGIGPEQNCFSVSFFSQSLRFQSLIIVELLFSSDPPFLLLLLLLRFVCQARIFSDCLSGAFTVCQCVRQCVPCRRACMRDGVCVCARAHVRVPVCL